MGCAACQASSISFARPVGPVGRPLFPCRFDLEFTDLTRNRAFASATYAVVGPFKIRREGSK